MPALAKVIRLPTDRKAERNAWGNETHNEYRTPRPLVLQLAEIYAGGAWELDAAAAPWNAQAPVFFTRRTDALSRPWFGRVWLNSPYNPKGTLERWQKYARAQALNTPAVKVVGSLVPHYTSEGWWQAAVDRDDDLGKLLDVRWFKNALGTCVSRRYERLVVDVLALKGRLRHTQPDGTADSARYASAFVVWRRPR